jgi:hypothetical protein
MAKKQKRRSKAEKQAVALIPVDDKIDARTREAMIGRPSIYSDELGARICRLIVRDYTLRQIQEIPGMPCMDTILTWAGDVDHPFSEHYVRAREVHLSVMEDGLRDIADDGRNDWMTIMAGGEEIQVENREVTSRSKLRVQTRQWILSHRRPKVFGPKKADDGVSRTGDLEAFRKLWDFISEGNKPEKAVVDATFEEVKS